MDLYYIMIFDPCDFISKGIYEIQKPTIEQDEETNATSIVKVNRYNYLGAEINYNIQELDFIFIKNDVKIIYNGIVTKVNSEGNYVEISYKDIINTFDCKIVDFYRNYSKEQREVGVEDAIAHLISANWTVGIHAQNSIMASALTHTPINANIPTEDGGIFNLATYINNVRVLYDIGVDFYLEQYKENPEYYNLIINIYKKEETDKRIIDLSKQTNVKEIYNSTCLSYVYATGPNWENKEFCLLKNREIKPMNQIEHYDDIVFGSRTSIYVDDWSTVDQEAINQFKSNNYEHLFQFCSHDEYDILEKVYIITSKGEKIETYISAKKQIEAGYEYKTGKLRVKFLDKFLQEKRG